MLHPAMFERVRENGETKESARDQRERGEGDLTRNNYDDVRNTSNNLDCTRARATIRYFKWSTLL